MDRSTEQNNSSAEMAWDQEEIPDSDLKVQLNSHHSDSLLQRIGLLDEKESLETLVNPDKMKAIADRFTLISNPGEEKIDGIELTWPQIQRMTAPPSGAEKIREVLQPARRKKRLLEQKEILFHASQEVGQVSLDASLYTFETAVKVEKVTDRLKTALERNFALFPPGYKDLKEKLRLAQKLLGPLEAQAKREGFTEADFVPKSDDDVNRMLRDTPPKGAAVGGAADGRVRAMRESVALLQVNLEQADNFLRDEEKVEELRSKAGTVGLVLPPIFDMYAQEWKKADEEFYVELNLPHADELLQKTGILARGKINAEGKAIGRESLEELDDPDRLKAISEEFTLISEPVKHEIGGMRLLWPQVESIFAKDQNEAKILFEAIMQVSRQNTSVEMNITKLNDLLRKTELQPEDYPVFQRNLVKFEERYTKMVADSKLMRKIIVLAEKSSLNADRIAEAREGLAIVKKLKKEADGFLSNLDSMAEVRSKAEAAGITLPLLFQKKAA